MFVGSSAAAQTKVSDSPAFGKVPPPEQERKCILVCTVGADGTLKKGLEVATGTHIGWLQQHPTNGHLYGVGGGRVRAYRHKGALPLEEFSSVDALGNPAHFELSPGGQMPMLHRTHTSWQPFQA